MSAKIRILYSADGALPEGVTLLEVYNPGPGWYAITPAGAAHRSRRSAEIFKLVERWLRQ